MRLLTYTPAAHSLRGSLPSEHARNNDFMVSSHPRETCMPLETIVLVSHTAKSCVPVTCRGRRNKTTSESRTCEAK